MKTKKRKRLELSLTDCLAGCDAPVYANALLRLLRLPAEVVLALAAAAAVNGSVSFSGVVQGQSRRRQWARTLAAAGPDVCADSAAADAVRSGAVKWPGGGDVEVEAVVARCMVCC